MEFRTIDVRRQSSVCFIRIDRPEADNAINALLVEEMNRALSECEEWATVIVLEGSPSSFCVGADFHEIAGKLGREERAGNDPEPLYDLWLRWAFGPFVSIAHVQGKTNAGGLGFVAASDIVIAGTEAQFSLSELLFGLLPACVMPFLIRRVGYQRAHYLTLTTQPISAQLAHQWGLADCCDSDSDALLRKHLLRLKRLSKTSIMRHKLYMKRLGDSPFRDKAAALAANREVFSDPDNLERISRFVKTGQFPWEQ